jgi:hypothetical protein
MRRVAAILWISFAIVLVLSSHPARVAAQAPQPRVFTRTTQLDEFERASHCDVGARLDTLVTRVQETPGATAYIIAYGPEGEGPDTGRTVLELIKDYFINTRGLEPQRVKTIYAGRNSDLKELRIQLWIVPKGARPPKPQKNETNIETFKGLFDDMRMWDDFGVYREPEMGPGIGGATTAGFADMLHQQKDAVAYIVGFNGKDAMPGAWRRVAQERIDDLKRYNLDAGRFKIVFGGQREATGVQFWIAPKDSPPPVTDAGGESPPGKAVESGFFSDYDFGDEKNEKAFFTHLVQILTEQKTVRAFLVVSLDNSPPGDIAPVADREPEPQSEPATPPEPVDEFQPADLTKLVEKWRLELANKHKIGPDRFIILFNPQEEGGSNSITLWIVPQGKPLPDPNTERTDAEEDKDPPK